MAAYVVRRLLAFIPTLLAVAVIVFFMIYLVPGDPVIMMLGVDAPADAIEAAREQLGLNDPLLSRLAKWFAAALKGDLGTSYFLAQPVTRALAERIPITFALSFFALVVAVLVGVLVGVLAGVKHGTLADWGVMLAALFGLSVPSFWLALNLILLFSVKLRLLPTGGYVPFVKDPVLFFKHLLMPGLALGLTHAAVIARMTRSSVLEVLQFDYIRTARAKGLPERRVVFKHTLKNALIPVITVIGLSMSALLGGSVITETVFNLPGVGRLVVEGVKRRDYPVVQGGILLVTCVYLITNLLVDLAYARANPRIRYS